MAYIEDELTHYHDTLREIERLRQDILHGGRSSLGGDDGGRGSGPSDPTARVAMALVADARIERMEKITRIIERVIPRLQPEKRKMVQIMYWDRPRMLTWQGVAIKLHITKRTAFRWRREIIHAIAEQGGFY
jgi:RinA family phage transcriptional activator